MKPNISIIAFMLTMAWWANHCNAQSVSVTVTGEVEFNQINSGFLGGVNIGDEVQMSFMLNASEFVDSLNFPTRGYIILEDSFSLTFAGAPIGLQDPFPMGESPLFVLRDNDPAVDGFFVANNVDFPTGVPIDQDGLFDQFRNNFSVTYENDPLSSLDILDATGTYDFTGLSVFNWTVDDGPFQPLGIVFSDLTISAAIVPEPTASLIVILVGIMASQRRVRRQVL